MAANLAFHRGRSWGLRVDRQVQVAVAVAEQARRAQDHPARQSVSGRMDSCRTK